MKITRSWAMPNKNTFGIAPIKDLLERYITLFDEVVPHSQITANGGRSQTISIRNIRQIIIWMRQTF